MRILLVHNRYQQPGGEDAVFEAEKTLLRQMGHEVDEFVEDNQRVNTMTMWRAASTTIWSRQTQRELERRIAAHRPDVAHFHNTFMLVSPAAYYTCQKHNIPVVQTLHNYRLHCPAGIFYRDGHICEDCLGRTIPWPGVQHACWRGSRARTGIVAAMLTTHRWLGTWQNQVDRYIAITQFARKKFIEGGLPEEKITVKPNFVMSAPLEADLPADERGYALFVGRLAPEKGVGTLLRTWQTLGEIPLMVVGDGPMLNEAAALAERHAQKRVEILGRQERAEVIRLMRGARFLIFPSEWYETFGMTIVEAFACGTPVIASRLGAVTELVDDGRTGLHFEAGNADDLAAKVTWAWSHPQEMAAMGKQARRAYEEKYTPEKNYSMLMDIYREAAHGAS